MRRNGFKMEKEFSAVSVYGHITLECKSDSDLAKKKITGFLYNYRFNEAEGAGAR